MDGKFSLVIPKMEGLGQKTLFEQMKLLKVIIYDRQMATFAKKEQ